VITVWKEQQDGGVTFPEGFVASAVRCGLKTEGDDLALIVSDSAASVAGLFTTNRVQASCVGYSRRVVRTGRARAIICNAGNANACNGEQGEEDTRRMAELVARGLNINPAEVLVAQTGVIGHPMPMEKIETGAPAAVEALDREPGTDMKVARAIMTTDTRPKTFAAECDSDTWNGIARFAGVCKGSGMIAPNMATMLCFLTCDARIPSPLLQTALARAVERTFNRTTVDGDTSTNDMVLALASGLGECSISVEGPAFEDFRDALERVCRHLAREVARDGEGATKLVEVVVQGAASEEGAARIAKTIAESPLVKTALFGNDPNWGRILMAAGRAGVPFAPATAEVLLGDIAVFREGTGVPFDEMAAHDYLKSNEIRITVDLHAGSHQATVWTCDYSYDYIKINAEYHT
jgi:glutamate N-acetyltransferase/amino-acid N-acetyltransferase